MTPKYLDAGACEPLPGQVGFLVERVHLTTGLSNWLLQLTPARTNRSHEPLLRGWCGSFNDLSTYARGLARAVAVTPSSYRVRLAEVTGPEVAAALEQLGFPELTPEGAADPSFAPTHEITLTRLLGASTVLRVCLSDGAAYTEDEWRSGTPADWECSDAGVWTFQGRAAPDGCEVAVRELNEGES